MDPVLSLQLLGRILPQLPSVEDLVVWGGYAGMFAIIYAETGLLVGFFLPGDSLLVTAGLFAATGRFDIFYLNALLIPAAIAGDATGYWIGLRAGHALYSRPQSRFFRRDHLLRTREFYERYGGVTIVIARFMPFARTFAPVVAGIGKMSYRRFVSFNVFGAVGWVFSMTMLGFLLSRAFPALPKHIDKVIIIIIAISLIPAAIGWLNSRRKGKPDEAKAPTIAA